VVLTPHKKYIFDQFVVRKMSYLAPNRGGYRSEDEFTAIIKSLLPLVPEIKLWAMSRFARNPWIAKL